MSSVVQSPVVGTVWKVLIAVGDLVAKGDEVMILESMKMEIPVEAEVAGTVMAIAVAEGDPVGQGDTLATIE
jgi:acetyl-CoA carboxylase biotin carboxyl carrier protein